MPRYDKSQGQPVIEDDDDESSYIEEPNPVIEDMALDPVDMPESNFEDESLELAPPPPAPAPVPVVDDRDARIAEYLRGQKAAGDDSGIKSAQESAGQSNFVANLGEAFETIGKANSMAHGGAGVDTGFYRGLRDQGQQGVQKATAARDSKLAQFNKQFEMERQIANDAVLRGTKQQQAMSAKILRDQNDPNSAFSKNSQASFKAIFSELPQFKDMDLSKYSARELAEMSKNANVLVKLSAVKASKENAASFRQGTKDAAREKEERNESRNQFDNLGKALDSETMGIRTNLGSAQNKVNGAVRLMTFAESTPEELERAKHDPKFRAEKIKQLNSLSPQAYAEVVVGLMQQVGASNALGQFEHMRQDTWDQTLAKAKSYFSNAPARAEAGPLIMGNLITLKNEQDTSQRVLDEHTKKMRQRFPLAFRHDATKEDAENLMKAYPEMAGKMGGGHGEQAASTESVPAAKHPQAQAAVEWAKKNPNDPDAQEILKRAGVMNAGI